MITSGTAKVKTGLALGTIALGGLTAQAASGNVSNRQADDCGKKVQVTEHLNTLTGLSFFSFDNLSFAANQPEAQGKTAAESLKATKGPVKSGQFEQEQSAESKGARIFSLMAFSAFLGSLTTRISSIFRGKNADKESADKPAAAPKGIDDLVSPGFLSKINEQPAADKQSSTLKDRVIDKSVGIWKAWEKVADMLPKPWNKIMTFGGPAVAATCGIVWFQSIVQIGLAGMQYFGDWLEPIIGTAAFLYPMFKADKMLSAVEKFFKIDPIEGWKRQAITRPFQAALLTGAAIWVQALNLTPFTYAFFGAACVGAGVFATRFLSKSSAAVWASVATALALPWSHLLTTRTFDVTVKAAGPDPEVAAWNVTTDLSVASHWKKIVTFHKEPEPTGKAGMVLLNRDVPLYIPSHRSANSFNGDFQSLVGKKVRVTTVGTWLKPLSPKLQPTIVKYQVIE